MTKQIILHKAILSILNIYYTNTSITIILSLLNFSQGESMKLILPMLLAFSFSAFASLNITKEEVIKAQNAWGDGIVRIGEVYQSKGDYTQAALEHILASYDYQDGEVLFKPTLASDIPFRPTVEGALSYFVAGNPNFSEDSGFAIKPWTNVRFDNHKIMLYGSKAISMGHYYFTDLSGLETKVEYTLAFIKRADNIKITVQDSSLPYTP